MSKNKKKKSNKIIQKGKKLKKSEKMKKKPEKKERKLPMKGSRTRRSVESDLQNATETFAAYASNLARDVLNLAAQGVGCKGAFDDVFGPDALQVQQPFPYTVIESVEIFVQTQIFELKKKLLE